jgi:hypothetical protein
VDIGKVGGISIRVCGGDGLEIHPMFHDLSKIKGKQSFSAKKGQ